MKRGQKEEEEAVELILVPSAQRMAQKGVESIPSIVDVIQHTASLMSNLQTTSFRQRHCHPKEEKRQDILMREAVTVSPLGVWDYLDHTEVMHLSGANSWWLGAAPWRLLCESFWRCNDPKTAEALGGWRPAFGAFSWVVKVGEEGKVAQLTACLRGIQRLATIGQQENNTISITTTPMTIIEEADDDDFSLEEDPRSKRRRRTLEDEVETSSISPSRPSSIKIESQRNAAVGYEDDLWFEFLSEDPREDHNGTVHLLNTTPTKRRPLAPPPLASLARIVCGATARAFADEHTRLALCAQREQCANAVVAAIRAWPHDARLAERGTRTLVYVQLAAPCGHNPTTMHAIVRSAFDRHGKTHPVVAENACAYALAVATEYTKSQYTRRSRNNNQQPSNNTGDLSVTIDPSVTNLEQLAASNFYDAVVLQTLVNCLNHATTKQQWNRKNDTVIVYAASALRELAVAAKSSRSIMCLGAVNRLRDSLVSTLFAIALQPSAPERVLKCVLTAVSKLATCSPRHYAIYSRLAPKARAAFSKRKDIMDSVNSNQLPDQVNQSNPSPYYQSPRHFAEYVVTPRQHRTN